ncbi:MAG: guanylate kinase [Candidatus Omnitrophota bacterium]
MRQPRARKSVPITGKLFVLSAPSGSGKTTLAERLLGDPLLSLCRSISTTTRPPRAGEKDGADYFFISKEEFKRKLRRKEFLEWEVNFGCFYGTPKRNVRELLRKGRSVLLSIDVRGAMNIGKMYPKRSVLIFVKPPSLQLLRERLMRRKTDRETDITTRLKEARRELSYAKKFDHTVVNDRLEDAYQRLRKIVLVESEQKKKG